MISCGVDDCTEKAFAKFTIKTMNSIEQYTFHLCKKHHDIYNKTDEYTVIVEILP